LALAGAVVAGGCLPRPVTAEGRQIADLYTAFTAIAAVVAAVVFGLATWSVIRYRGRPADGLPSQVHGSLRVELVWTAIPIVIIFGLFAVTLGVLTRVEAVTAAPRAEVRVEAYRWGWRASYPGTPVVVTGLREPGPTIVVPVGEPIRVTLASADVVHAFYVPLFLFKRDAIPGRDSVFEITIAEPGDYGGQCAEFCGIYHARMPFTIRAVERADYDAWLASQAAASPSPPPALPSPSQSPVSS
jgi:cytochrome c oxidase subunit 2